MGRRYIRVIFSLRRVRRKERKKRRAIRQKAQRKKGRDGLRNGLGSTKFRGVLVLEFRREVPEGLSVGHTEEETLGDGRKIVLKRLDVFEFFLAEEVFRVEEDLSRHHLEVLEVIGSPGFVWVPFWILCPYHAFCLASVCVLLVFFVFWFWFVVRFFSRPFFFFFL